MNLTTASLGTVAQQVQAGLGRLLAYDVQPRPVLNRTLGGFVHSRTKPENPTALRRELGFLDLLMVSLGSIIGAGWLFSAGRAAVFAGPSSLISWVIGGVAALSV